MAALGDPTLIVDGECYTLDELIKTRRPNWSLPQPFYTDAIIYRIEMERIFRRGWLFAGHTCQLRKPGDYFLYNIDTESIIVTRDRDNQIRALFNFCRHRGTRLCHEPAGHVGKFVCPYHQWVYELDGKLLKTSWMGDNFDSTQFALQPAHVRELDGLIFINLADNPQTFDNAHEHISTVIRPHRLARAKIAHATSYDIAANWKLVIENQRECLHCPGNHPEYLRAYFDFDVDNPDMQQEIESCLAESRERWAEQGLDVSRVNMSSAYTGLWYRANRTPFRKGFVTESFDGQPLAPLMGDFKEPDMGTARAGTYLNFWIHATSDHAASIQVTPLNPTTTRWTATWLVHEDAVEGVDYDVDRLIEFTLTQSKQDWEILDNQGLGVRSSRYKGGPYSPLKETNVEKFIEWYLHEMSNPAEYRRPAEIHANTKPGKSAYMQDSPNRDAPISADEANRYTRLSILCSEELYGEDFQSPGGQGSVSTFAEELQITSDTTILDIGSGLGGAAFYFAAQFGASVVGIDASPDMIEISNERLAKHRHAGISFRRGRIEDESLDAETFDIAWTRDSIVCVQAKDRLWKNVYHCLKPGGRLFATDFCRNQESVTNEFSEHAAQCEYYPQDLDQYVSTLAAAGFRNIIAEDLTDLLIEFLHQEQATLKEKQEGFVGKYGAAEFQFLHERWAKKIRFCEQGDLKWGKFTARK